MANLRDIKKRITSVTSTKQITRTMEMVATARIRRATDRVVAATPYSEAMLEMLTNLANKTGKNAHPLLEAHPETKNTMFIVIASDRGLAGGFNTQILRAAEKDAHSYAEQDIGTSFILCGRKSVSYFEYRGFSADLNFMGISASPTFDQASHIASYVSDKYTTGQIDEVLIYYNHMRNAAIQDVCIERLLPVELDTIDKKESKDSEVKYQFDPNKKAVLNKLVPACVETTVYHALIDSAAGEQAARRRAMKSATDNATDIINTLQRQYNTARQGAITTELTEIIAGASAQKKEV